MEQSDTQQQQLAADTIPQIDKDMARKFGQDLSNFLINFTETWESSVSIHSIIPTIILVLQKVSFDTAEVMIKDCMEQDFDLLGQMAEDFAEKEKEIRLKHNLKERESNG